MRLAVPSILAMLFASIAMAQDKPASEGKIVYDKWCTPCHGAGLGKPGTMVLAQRYGDSLPALLEERTDLSREYLANFVRQGVGVMPQFRKTEITDAEFDALVNYLVERPR